MATPSPFADRAVLITGCSSGIGYTCALGLQAAGYRVFATARQEADLMRLAAQGLETVALDLRDSDSIHHAVDAVLSRTGGKLYGLFNNAAYGLPGALEDITREQLRTQFESNVFGTHELTAALIPTFRNQGYGRIIQNSSILGVVSMAYMGAYNASKYALEGLSDTLRLELPAPIYVSLIEPGPIESSFRRSAQGHFQGMQIEDSVHQKSYTQLVARYQRTAHTPFTRPPTAVLKVLRHALEARRPKVRYPVTVPSHLFQVLKRCLPARTLDALLRYAERADSTGKN